MQEQWQRQLPSWEVKVALRGSALSRKQLEEVFGEMRFFWPRICFFPLFVTTKGDRDQTTPLSLMEKTDFFTAEVDEKVLEGSADVAVHSAKDLPEKLPQGLCIAALTKGRNPSDSLVFRKGLSLATFPKGGKVGISSDRREENVRAFLQEKRPSCLHIRGAIDKRLAYLTQEGFSAVVVAKAALERLGYTLPSILLPGPVPPLQGRLAIVVKQDDLFLRRLFEKIDAR